MRYLCLCCSFQITSFIMKAKVYSWKYSNETRAVQEKRKLFLRFVRNIVKKVDLNVHTIGLYACEKIFNI